MSHKNEKGFTLVEMSIVLVIIGLIVGGVLVGQDLVKAAQIRATVTQLEQFNAALNTFRGKYNAMPGDISKAVAFGLGAGTDGNGNARLDDDSASIVAGNVTAGYDEELQWFWVHLTAANMVGGNYVYGAADSGTAGINFPATKLKKGGILAISEGSVNYWLVGVNSTITNAASFISATAGLNPTEAYGIDVKVDDGFANTGQMIQATAVGAGADEFTRNPSADTDATSSDCDAAVTTAGDPADFNLAFENNVCTMTVRMQG